MLIFTTFVHFSIFIFHAFLVDVHFVEPVICFRCFDSLGVTGVDLVYDIIVSDSFCGNVTLTPIMLNEFVKFVFCKVRLFHTLVGIMLRIVLDMVNILVFT